MPIAAEASVRAPIVSAVNVSNQPQMPNGPSVGLAGMIPANVCLSDVHVPAFEECGFGGSSGVQGPKPNEKLNASRLEPSNWVSDLVNQHRHRISVTYPSSEQDLFDDLCHKLIPASDYPTSRVNLECRQLQDDCSAGIDAGIVGHGGNDCSIPEYNQMLESEMTQGCEEDRDNVSGNTQAPRLSREDSFNVWLDQLPCLPKLNRLLRS